MGRSKFNCIGYQDNVLKDMDARILAEAEENPAFQDYVKKTRRTDLSDDEYNADMSKYEDYIAPLHYCLGIMTEAGEIASLVKKEVFYEKQIASDKLKLEIGDLLWYVARLLDLSDLTFEECMEANIAKLEKRYPSGFDGTGGKR